MNTKKTKGGLALITLSVVILIIIPITMHAENSHPTTFTQIDTTQTLQSFDHVGAFHILDYIGDYSDILDYVNGWFAKGNMDSRNHFFCSLFSALGNADELLMGRNFDNPYCDILVGRYNPPDGYSNIALNRLGDLGLPAGTDFQNLTYNQSLKLLYAPYFAADGVNETGLAIGVAYVPSVQIQVDPNKESVWVTRIIREVLDHASTVDEALDIANSFNVFDSGANNNILSHHYIVTNVTGASYILEYVDSMFVAITPGVDWQVLTNSHIYNVPLQQLLNGCWRYKSLYTSLQNYDGCIDFLEGFGLLSGVSWGSQAEGTQWSAMYDINNCGAYISTYRDYKNLVYADVKNFEFLNFSGYNVRSISYEDENTNYIIESDESAEIYITVEPNFKSTGLIGTLKTNDAKVNILHNEVDFGTINIGEFGCNIDDPFIIQAANDITPHTVNFALILTTDYGFSYDIDFSLFIGTGNVLLVNDNPEKDYSKFYQNALAENNRTGHIWDEEYLGDIPSSLYNSYNSLIWFTGDATGDILSANEINELIDFMDRGGNVLLTGQDVCEDIKETELFSDYFHAKHELDAWPFYNISGIDNDPIGEELSFSITGGSGANNQVTQSAILADDQADICFTYDACPVSCGVRYSGQHKSVLLSFGFEGISTLEDRAKVMNRIMQYFEVPFSNDPSCHLQNIVCLESIAPNPLSTSTKISYSLPRPVKVKIQIYNLKGQFIETLLDEHKQAGNHSFDWNTKVLSPGIYFCKLSADNTSSIKKIVIIK